MAQGLTVTLTTDPTLIAGSGIHGNIRVTVRNRGAGNVYLGSSGVTTAGFQVSTGDAPHTFIVQGGENFYGTSTGSIVVDVLRMGETT